ncbi:MAG: DsbA family oxidoreductase, partial [Bacteroidetes bacterium]|nr:DsbA family oxidoreductase [Bacteroidota bacterium]
KIEIWSDVMCPFCYIGKRNFEEALHQFKDKNEIDVEWKSFQLDPTIPENMPHTNVLEYLAQKKGMSKEQTKQSMSQVTEMAKSVGLELNFDTALVANSLKAHRLIQKAKEKGLGAQAEERLFKAHFVEGKDFGNINVLKELGIDIGLKPEDIDQAMQKDEYEYQVKLDIQEARQLGVNGVPFFVFNRKYGISGAQPTKVFTSTLEQSFAEWRKENPASKLNITQGPACDIEGNCD